MDSESLDREAEPNAFLARPFTLSIRFSARIKTDTKILAAYLIQQPSQMIRVD